jgi:hypothetical protein
MTERSWPRWLTWNRPSKRSFLGLFRPGTDGFGGSLLPAFFLFTIHEEIGSRPDAALPIAGCTFPIVFLGSLIGYLVKKVGGRSR